MKLTQCPGAVFERVSIGIMGPIGNVSADGYEYILMIQCQLSKFLVAVPLRNIETPTVATAFINSFICSYGTPRELISDRGVQFVSNLMRAVARRFKIKQITTCAYSPSSNGMVERSNHVITEYLRNYTNKYKDWHMYINLATFCYNNTIHSSTGYCPQEIVFGFLARMPSETKLKESEKLPSYKNYLIDLVSRLIGIRQIANENLYNAKVTSKQYHDSKLNVVDFEIGDIVFLSKGGEISKPNDPYTGPYEIVQKFSDHNVKIQKVGTNSTQIVHVRRLKKPTLRAKL